MRACFALIMCIMPEEFSVLNYYGCIGPKNERYLKESELMCTLFGGGGLVHLIPNSMPEAKEQVFGIPQSKASFVIGQFQQLVGC